MGNGFFDPNQAPQFMQVGSPDDVSNVNPLTEGATSGIANLQNLFKGMLGGQFSQDFADPTAAVRAFTQGGIGSDLFGLASGATSPLEQQLNSLGQRQAGLALSNIGDQFSSLNALHSGAFGDAAGSAVGNIFAQNAANIAGQQLGLGGQLAAGGLGALSSGFNTGTQAQAGVGSSLIGALTGLQGQMTGLGAPEFFQPENVEIPSFDFFNDLLPLLIQGAGTAASFFPGQ